MTSQIKQDGSRPVWDWLLNISGSAAGKPLAWHPRQLTDCVAARGMQPSLPLDEEALKELEQGHVSWGADLATLDNIQQLGRGNTRVVVTGQQPGLLAGPLLVIYKTLTAVQLAVRLKSEQPELEFVPVFWLAGEDHDFSEVKHVRWPAAASLEISLLLPDDWRWGQMVGTIQTQKFWERFKEHLQQTLGRTEFSDEVTSLLEAAYAGQDANVEDAFALLLLRLMRGLGVVIVSPRMKWLRRRAAPILEREFAAAGAMAEKINTRGQELARQFGIESPLVRAPGALNAFWIDDEGRRWRLHSNENGKIVRALPKSDHFNGTLAEELPAWTADELQRQLKENPEQFSTNVVTRPMLQDSALPTVAQVVGPGEADYLAQVESVYPDFGVFAPVRWPRAQALLIEPRVERAMEKYGIVLDEALQCDLPELEKIALTCAMAETQELRELEALQSRQKVELETFKIKLNGGAASGKGSDPAIEGAFNKLQQAQEKGFATLRDRLLYQRQQDEGHLQRAMATISHALRPAGLDQERALNPCVPFAWNYGLDWISNLAHQLEPEAPGIQVIRMAELAGEK